MCQVNSPDKYWQWLGPLDLVMIKALYCGPVILGARSRSRTFEVESLKEAAGWWVLPLADSSGRADLTLRTINYLQPHILNS